MDAQPSLDWISDFLASYPAGLLFSSTALLFTCVVLAYGVFRISFSPVITSFVLCFFAASIPANNVSQMLMARHYLEGSGLTCAAFLSVFQIVANRQPTVELGGRIFLPPGVRSKRNLCAPGPCLSYFFRSVLKKKLRFLFPFFSAASNVYSLAFLYAWCVNNLFSGYGDVFGRTGWPDILGLPVQIIRMNTANSRLLRYCSGCCMSAYFYLCWLGGFTLHQKIFAFVLSGAIFAPVIPVIPICRSAISFFQFLRQVSGSLPECRPSEICLLSQPLSEFECTCFLRLLAGSDNESLILAIAGTGKIMPRFSR